MRELFNPWDYSEEEKDYEKFVEDPNKPYICTSENCKKVKEREVLRKLNDKQD